MRRALLLALLLLPLPALAQRSVERLFYYVDTEDGWQSLNRHIGAISLLAPGGYSTDEQGVVWGEVDPRVLRLAREHGVPVMPLIVNPGFDQEKLHRLLADDGARARVIRSLVEICRRNGYAGIQFDFENLAMADRDRFTRVVQEAARALHRNGLRLSVATVHRTEDSPGPTRYHKWLWESWRAGYDLKALGEAADFLSIMSYSQHTRRTPPGPQASVPWTRAVVEEFLKSVPPEKLSLGIPVGSQHWYTSQEESIRPELARSYSEQLSHARAMGLAERYGAAPQWSEPYGVAYTFFPRGGTWEWIFFEDARSFQAKLALVDRYQLRGFSVWVLGPEDPGIWEVLGERGGANLSDRR